MDFSNPQCTIQNYPNHVISALGDKLFFCVQFCTQSNQNYAAQGLETKELSHVKKSANRVCKCKFFL